MTAWRGTLAVATGSAIGAVLRHGAGDLAAATGGGAWPVDTLLVNALGAFLMGWLAVVSMHDGRHPLGDQTRLFLTGGVCGGFTTFSVFSLESLDLLIAGAWGAAALNIGATLVLAIGAAAAGALLGRR